MLSCACSVRALELFVKDFAGIRLRQQRSHIHFYQQRRFGTRPPFRQLQPSTITTGRLDDGFVPFDTDATKSESLIETGDVLKEDRKVEGREPPQELDEEWHAEVEITSPLAQDTGVAYNADAIVLQDASGDNAAKGIDVEQAEGNSTPVDIGATETANAPLLQLETSSIPSKGKAPKRLERKRRRIESGAFAKYKKPSQDRIEEKTSKERAQTILEQFEALAGPDTIHKKPTKEDRHNDENRITIEQENKALKKKALESPADRVARKAAHKAAWKAEIAGPTASEERKPQRRAAAGKPALEPWQVKLERRVEPKTKRERGNAVGVQAVAGERPSHASKKGVIAETSNARPKKESWQVQKDALNRKFGEQGWQPRKRLSPDTIEGIRALHVSDSGSYSTKTLSEHFQVTPEAIRRILKSKWRPNTEEAEDRRERWEKRGVRKWTEMAQQGVRPPAKWRAMGIRSTEPGESKKKPRWRNEGKDVQGSDHIEERSGNSLASRIL